MFCNHWYHHHHTFGLKALSLILVLFQISQFVIHKSLRKPYLQFLKQRFTMETSLSQKPLYHGALVKLNFQLMFWFEANFWVSWEVKTAPLSLINSPGQPLRAINFLKLCTKFFELALSTNSKTTPFVDVHVYKTT